MAKNQQHIIYWLYTDIAAIHPTPSTPNPHHPKRPIWRDSCGPRRWRSRAPLQHQWTKVGDRCGHQSASCSMDFYGYNWNLIGYLSISMVLKVFHPFSIWIHWHHWSWKKNVCRSSLHEHRICSKCWCILLFGPMHPGVKNCRRILLVSEICASSKGPKGDLKNIKNASKWYPLVN